VPNVIGEKTHLVALTTFELEAIAFCNPMGWANAPGLTGPEKQAVKRVVQKLKAANLRAQTEKIQQGKLDDAESDRERDDSGCA